MALSDYPSDWEKRRAKVLDRDGHECVACGITNDDAEDKYGRGLHVHHLNPISEGGGHSIDNLITLCEPCHCMAHSKNDEKPYEPVKWYTCFACGREYSNLDGYNRTVCSKRCGAARKVEKAINHVDNDTRICSTCFTELGVNQSQCRNCGNWEPCERKPELLEDASIDWEHLLLRVLYWNIYNK